MNLRPGASFQLATELARADRHPRLCVIATAVGDDSARLAAAHNAFAKLGFVSSHLTLFPMPNYPDVRAHLLAQDIIWVGGGSTANLLALWRLHGLDEVLRECWEAGVVLKGVSAGSLCWHVGVVRHREQREMGGHEAELGKRVVVGRQPHAVVPGRGADDAEPRVVAGAGEVRRQAVRRPGPQVRRVRTLGQEADGGGDDGRLARRHVSRRGPQGSRCGAAAPRP